MVRVSKVEGVGSLWLRDGDDFEEHTEENASIRGVERFVK